MEGGRVEPGPALNGLYQLQGLLGRGGLGDLYRARAVKSAAVHALRLTDIPDAAAVLDALGEVIALNERLSHASLARIRTSGGDAGRIWYAMDLIIDGESLLARVRSNGTLGAREAALLVLQACEAVATLHDAGVVHQDLSPRNLFTGGHGVTVLELGIAPALARLIREKPGLITTPRVRAAEQLVCAEPDPRTDLYALGTILYYLVTGRKAIPEGGAVLQLATDGKVPPPRIDGVPLALRPILERALALRPVDRFSSVRELARSLSEVG
jgi:serine/threonine-protein kinase